MTNQERFEKEWAKLSTLKDPINKETARLFFTLGVKSEQQSKSK